MLAPGPLFNPLTVAPSEALTPSEILAGPYGLLAFLPLVPALRLVARRRRRAALVVFGLLWLVLTLGPMSTGVFLAAVAAGALWVVVLRAARLHERLSARTATVLAWLGLHVLVLPAWWWPSWNWYGWEPSRLPLLHNIGLAYFLLRFVAWGRQVARQPAEPLRPLDTACWILYPPCMRLGPVLLRDRFLERLEAWVPHARPAWREVGRRLGLFLLGGVTLGVVVHNTPHLAVGQADFFAAPEDFPTDRLLTWVYLIPVQVYLLLWTYNELAAGLAAWVGIRVDDNFNWLPTATSVRDFWRRWHVTVGAWVREYIYIPLGGNRRHVWLNYVAVFGYMGLWHGPSWSFVAWGLLQALALIVQRHWDRLRARLGWTGRPAGAAWTTACWLLTIHFAVITIVVFVDFDHLGLRLFGELWRRLAAHLAG